MSVRVGVKMVGKSKVNPRVMSRTVGILSRATGICNRSVSCARLLVKKTSVSIGKIPLARRALRLTGSDSTILVNSVNNSTGASP